MCFFHCGRIKNLSGNVVKHEDICFDAKDCELCTKIPCVQPLTFVFQFVLYILTKVTRIATAIHEAADHTCARRYLPSAVSIAPPVGGPVNAPNNIQLKTIPSLESSVRISFVRLATVGSIRQRNATLMMP